MVDLSQVQKYVQNLYHESDSSDRIEDRGFAFYINTQPRAYLDTKDRSKMTRGNGPIVILKDTGEIFWFSSSPLHMFGDSGSRIGVNAARTAEEFQNALMALQDKGASSKRPDRLDATI